MKITAQNYQQMRSWFSRMVAETLPTTPENHPIAYLDRMAAEAPSKARQGLAMAINDTVENTDRWSPEKVKTVDDLLEREGLPTLTDMRLRFSKVIRRVVARGSIKNDVEHYAIRNAAELSNDDAEALWKLLSAYEERATT